MKYFFARITAPFLLAALVLMAAPVAEPQLPNEALRYTINWPSGLSLGEAQLSASSSAAASSSPEQMHFQFDLDAGVPGFAVSDRYRADASGNFCSMEFQKVASHGSRKTDDKEMFDSKTGTITRGTGSGQSQMSASACSKDALTFLYFLRQELGQGRIPPRQTVYFGAPYEIRLDSGGTESLKVGNTLLDADLIKASVKGPASSISFDMFFLKDRARTLALVRVPLPLGTFTMELEK
jgi:Protein of unknown function (DUF3108)